MGVSPANSMSEGLHHQAAPEPARVGRSITLHTDLNISVFSGHYCTVIKCLCKHNTITHTHTHTHTHVHTLTHTPQILISIASVDHYHCSLEVYRIVIMTECFILPFHFKTSPSAFLFQPPAVNQENLAQVYRCRLDPLSKELCRMLLHVMRTPQITVLEQSRYLNY